VLIPWPNRLSKRVNESEVNRKTERASKVEVDDKGEEKK
jgi:hypothetical protein